MIPFLDEREVLALCHERVSAVLKSTATSTEIIYVDDGSSDGSAEILLQFIAAPREATEPAIQLVRLSRNFGKESAMMAGIEHARGAAVVILDADLQDPPELIPDMVAAWKTGADVVCMQRRTRAGEGWFKRLSAYAYYRLLQKMSRSPMPVDTGDFRLMSRTAVQALRQLPERCRYMKGLYAWIGLPTRILTYDRAPRAAGRSRWRYGALAGLALEGMTSFSVSPLRWATGIGAVAALGGAGYGLGIVASTAFSGTDVPGYPSLVALVTFMGGIQLLTVGLLGEYVGKTYMESKQRPLYLVRDVQQSVDREHAEG